jgi:hypothetical protein
MSDLAGLTFIDPPAAPDSFNVLLFGPVKQGKSTAAATSPGPLLWVNAEGPNSLDYARKIARERGTQILEVRIEQSGDARELLREVLRYVKTPTGPAPATVVVDTIGKVREALARQLVTPGSSKSMQQWQQVATVLREFVRVLRDAPVNLVLIAHESVEDAEDERIVRPLIGGVLTEEIPGEVDVVAYVGTAIDDETGEVSYLGQLAPARGRRTGDRSGGLGRVRPLDLTEWLETYRAALGAPSDGLPWDGDPSEPTPDELEEGKQETLA